MLFRSEVVPAISTTANSTVALAGTTSGGSGAAQITWQTDQGASGLAVGSALWTVAAVPLVVGSNTITVTAMDSSQKAVQTTSVSRTASTPVPVPNPVPIPPVSGAPPSLSITSPAGSITTTSEDSIDVAGTASDSVGVSQVTWQSAVSSGTATGTTNWTAQAVPLLVGDNTIVVRAYDAAGNSSWRSVLVIRD